MIAKPKIAIPDHIPFFGSSLSAHLACRLLTTFIKDSHYIDRTHSSLVPLRQCAGRFSLLSRACLPVLIGGYIVPGASHQAVTSFACPGRERLMEQPVLSVHISSCKTEIHATFRSHSGLHPRARSPEGMPPRDSVYANLQPTPLKIVYRFGIPGELYKKCSVERSGKDANMLFRYGRKSAMRCPQRRPTTCLKCASKLNKAAPCSRALAAIHRSFAGIG